MSLLLTLLLPFAAQAVEGRLDYSVRAAGRLYSLGAIAEGIAGYGVSVWGDPSQPLFGYVRPSASVGSSGLTNQARADFEIFPISVLGVRFGHSWTSRSSDLPGFDCEAVNCRGWLEESIVALRALGAYGPVFGALDGEWRFFRQVADRSRPVAETFLGFVISPRGEETRTWRATLGYRLDERWSVGVQGARSRSASDDRGLMDVGFVRYQEGRWTALVGAGRFAGAPTFGSEFTGVFMLTWVGLPRMGF
jgi:hypothetical protein